MIEIKVHSTIREINIYAIGYFITPKEFLVFNVTLSVR